MGTQRVSPARMKGLVVSSQKAAGVVVAALEVVVGVGVVVVVTPVVVVTSG